MYLDGADGLAAAPGDELHARAIATRRLGGVAVTIYQDGAHMRGGRSAPDWAVPLFTKAARDLPEGFRVRVEAARDKLHGFAVWNDEGFCLPWDATLEWLALLGLPAAPVAFDGPLNRGEPLVRQLPPGPLVVRTASGFRLADYPAAVFQIP